MYFFKKGENMNVVDAHLERLLLTNASLSFLLRSASVFLRRTSSSSSFDPSSESKDLWLQAGQNLEKIGIEEEEEEEEIKQRETYQSPSGMTMSEGLRQDACQPSSQSSHSRIHSGWSA